MEIAAFLFVVVMLGVAYIAFRILKRTVKLAFRLILVLLIVLVAVAGGIYLSGYGNAERGPSASGSK